MCTLIQREQRQINTVPYNTSRAEILSIEFLNRAEDTNYSFGIVYGCPDTVH